MFDGQEVKSSNSVNRFQNWLHTVSIKDVCKWYLKWNVLAFVIFIVSAALLASLGDDLESVKNIGGILIEIPLIILFCIFNFVVTNRIMRIKKTTILSCLLSNAITMNAVVSLFGNIDDFLKYEYPFLNVLPMILITVFFCVIYQYAYEVYRIPVLLVILASIINIGGVLLCCSKEFIREDSPMMIFLLIIIAVLIIVSYILLYKIAQKYNM